jgi:hypothetical protein
MIPERLIVEFKEGGIREVIDASKQRSVTYRILTEILLISKYWLSVFLVAVCAGLGPTVQNLKFQALRTHFSASKMGPYCVAVERIRLLAGSIRKVNETK